MVSIARVAAIPTSTSCIPARGIGSAPNALRATGYRFSILTGTIFENTNKPLRDWFRVTQHVIGAVHTNTIEGFWSILKRGVIGTYHTMTGNIDSNCLTVSC
jgi:hypothetical protein